MKKNFVLLFQFLLSAALLTLGAISQAQQVKVTYDNAGSWTVTIPAAATSVTGQAWGGGGSGGSSYNSCGNVAVAGGGGGGGYTVRNFGVGGGSMAVTVGSGAGTAARNSAGTAGAASKFTYNGITATANGGSGGGRAYLACAIDIFSSKIPSGGGGNGGGGSTGDQNLTGNRGGNGDQGGYGGGSPNGGSNTSNISTQGDGYSGNFPGGGGSGAYRGGGSGIGDAYGGAGAGGRVIISFDYPVATPEIEGESVVCQGGNVTLSVKNPITTDGVRTYTYQWRRNGVDIEGAIGTSYTINNATTNDEGNYTVVAIYTCNLSAFSGATGIEGDGVSSPSAGITIVLGPFYTAEIASEGPGTAWFYNPGNPEDKRTNIERLCGSTVYPKVDASAFGVDFHFVGFYTSEGVFLSEDPDYTFVLSKNENIVARFDTNTHNVQFLAVREDGTPAPELGYTTGSGTYKHFHAVTGTATAEEHCEFAGWRDAFTKEPVSAEIASLQGDITYEAVFKEITHNVTTSVAEVKGGTTTGDNTYSQFVITEQAKVEAFADYGFTFEGWEMFIDGTPQGSIITDNPYMFLENERIENSYHFTAIFDTSVYTVAVSGANGITTGSGNYLHNRTATLTATADEGYHFVEWQSNGVQLGTEPTLIFNVLQDTAINAVFEINTYPVSVTMQGNGEYAAEASPAGTYEHFSEFNLKAIPQPKNEFRFWIVNGDTISTDQDKTITIDGEKIIVGVFTPTRKRVTVTAEPDNYGIVSGAGLYEHGKSVEISATAFYG
ncbi:MAG: hypothetical protein LBR45_04020, partial [Bacteroidales bacterium]|nr:hypothetical protein [Bacteroidales bacterium]